MVLISMSGRDNVLTQFLERSFASIKEAVPYHYSEDLETVLKAKSLDYQKQRLDIEVNFPDQRENRLKILRFLLTEHFAKMNQEKLLRLFDPYATSGRIVINTWHCHFVVRR